MKYTIIAPVGDNMPALFVGLKDFPTEKVILITPANKMKEAQKTQQDLERFKIPCKIVELGKDNVWEETFQKIAEIKEIEHEKNIIVNTATGDRSTTCAATSAAFVNGLKAISVEGDNAMILPVLKFSYYKLLSDRKLAILKILAEDKTCCKSLEELSRKTKMSMPLISYHVNGNLKSEGLLDLGLIDVTETKGRLAISLSMLGRMLIKGYVKIPTD